MRLPRATFLLVVLVRAAFAAEPGIEFSGVIESPTGVTVILTDRPAGLTMRVALGGDFQGYNVTSYDSKANTVVLTKGGAQTTLTLKVARVQAAHATPVPPSPFNSMSRAAQTTLFEKLRGLDGDALFVALVAEARTGLPQAAAETILSAQATIVEEQNRKEQLARDLAKTQADFQEYMRVSRDTLTKEEVEQRNLAFERATMQYSARNRQADAKSQSIRDEVGAKFKAALAASLAQPGAR